VAVVAAIVTSPLKILYKHSPEFRLIAVIGLLSAGYFEALEAPVTQPHPATGYR